MDTAGNAVAGCFSLLNELIKSSKECAEKNKRDSQCAERMRIASQGQSPRLLLISPIDRESQDLEMLSILQGDAFHASRIPHQPLLTWSMSPILFAGPSAYFGHFPDRQAVVLTFEMDESSDVVEASVRHVAENPDLHNLRIAALRMDYDGGKARLIPHGLGRAYEVENKMLALAHRPDRTDRDTLVVICSDSRVRSPPTPNGLPMSIQTLGGYLPVYTGEPDETVYLDSFLGNWLSDRPEDKHILLVAHGNFEGEGPSCGAGKASLSHEAIDCARLKHAIELLDREASLVESSRATSPEERVKSIAAVTRTNILSYPSIARQIQAGRNAAEFIQTVLMDTVTNALFDVEYKK